MKKLSRLVAFCLTITNLHAIVLSRETVRILGHQQPEGIPYAAAGMGVNVDPGERSAAFPFWDNVGSVGLGTGVYLGNGWVLTSAHVGCLPFKHADGTSYRPITETWRVLVNPDGSKSDLALFRVEAGGDASALRCLPEVPISIAGIESKTSVILVGTGYVEHATRGSAAQFGVQQRSTREKRWALATTDQVKQPAVTADGYRTHCFVTTFTDKASGGQAAEGDSGGAAFVFDPADRQWKLAGCIFAVSQLDSFVPYGARTYVGDLAIYGPQIEERTRISFAAR